MALPGIDKPARTEKRGRPRMEDLAARGYGLIQIQAQLAVLAGFMKLREINFLRPSAMFAILVRDALRKHELEQAQIRALDLGGQRQELLPFPKPSAPPEAPPLPARPVIPARVRGAIRTARENARSTPATSSSSSKATPATPATDAPRKELPLPLEDMKRSAFLEGVLQGERAGAARLAPLTPKSLKKTKADRDALLVVLDKLCVDGGWRQHITTDPNHHGIAPREDLIFGELEAGFVSGLRAEVHRRKTSKASTTSSSAIRERLAECGQRALELGRDAGRKATSGTRPMAVMRKIEGKINLRKLVPEAMPDDHAEVRRLILLGFERGQRGQASAKAQKPKALAPSTSTRTSTRSSSSSSTKASTRSKAKTSTTKPSSSTRSTPSTSTSSSSTKPKASTPATIAKPGDKMSAARATKPKASPARFNVDDLVLVVGGNIHRGAHGRVCKPRQITFGRPSYMVALSLGDFEPGTKRTLLVPEIDLELDVARTKSAPTSTSTAAVATAAMERKARTDKLYDLAEDLGAKDHETGRVPTPARVREVVTYCRKTIEDTDASDRVIGERYADGYAPPDVPPEASATVQPGGET